MAESTEVSKLPGDVFRDAFNASPIGIVLEDLEGRPLFVNPAFCSMFGLDEAEVLGKHCVDFSPAEDAQKDWALFGQLRAGSIDHYQLDKRYFRRDGSLFWGHVSISLLNHRPAPLVIAIVQDVTERMVAQQTLELATQELIGVTRCGRDFRYQWVSPGYATWLRRPASEIVGHPIVELLGPETFHAVKPYFDRVLAGETVAYEMELDFPGIGRRWRSATYTPSRDASGAVDGWVAVVFDITDRKRAEKERLRNAAIVESTDDAVLSMDLDGIILSWNHGAQHLFGYTEAEAIGRPITMLVPEEQHEHDNICRRLRRGEHIERLETRRLTKDGRRIDVSLTISPICDERGEMVGSCDIARDISERKQFEKSLLWHLDFERLLSDLSRTFISLPDDEIDANVERALAEIGGFLGIDRITVYEFSPERTQLTISYMWAVPGVMASPVAIRPIELPFWMNKVMHGEVSLASRVDDLPEDASAEKEFLRRWGVVSTASIPLNVGGEITGAISFVTLRREVSWTDDLVRQLRVISDILSNALKRKHAMAQLRAAQAVTRESEERFRLVANSTPAMIWMAGVDTRCTYFNQSWLAFTGRSLEAETGHGWAEGVHPEDVNRCLSTYTEAFNRRQRFEMEYRLRRHDGRYRWLLDIGAPRFNLDGSFAGYVGSCVDVTDQKEADVIRSSFSRRLILAQEEERAAVGRELHDDINQRVGLAMLNLESLKSNVHTAGDLKQEIAGVIGQLGELAADIQALSHRLHSSRLEQLGLRAAAEGFCREVAATHKVEIAFRSDEIPKEIRSEISLCLFRVLQEAVQNSTKHSGTTQLEVALRAEANEIQLTVSDSGTGFDLHEATRGEGIGLANMRERLRLVRGQLWIESEPGRGTVMHARVPLGPRPNPQSSAGV